MKKYFLLIVLLLVACGQQDKNAKSVQTFTVTPHKLSNILYFSGIIQPLKSVIITTPAEGVITDMAFHYGDTVKDQQALFSLSSDKFRAEYKTSLMAYIKAKTDFNNNQVLLHESEFLHKNQLISDDDFKAKQTNFFNAQLSLMQAKDALGTILKQMEVKDANLFSLSIENVDKIDELLHAQKDSQTLHISAPASGVILLPVKGDNDSQSKKLVKGDQVKQGDVLAMVGDMSGLSIHINVNEYNINQLKLGQKVKVTGTAFPEFVLEGQIAGIDRQGQISQGGVPMFPVEIIVPQIDAKAQQSIHIGMSAKVEVQIDGPEVLTVPIAAVNEKNGAAYLHVANGKKSREIMVKTGQTTDSEVVIESNLKAGDRVVILN